MSKETAKKLTPEEWQARFDAAAKAAQREYCNIFKFWIACRYKPCRRAKTCSGDALACLKRSLNRVPGEIKNRAFDRIVWETPATADAPTKTARRFSPHDFSLW